MDNTFPIKLLVRLASQGLTTARDEVCEKSGLEFGVRARLALRRRYRFGWLGGRPRRIERLSGQLNSLFARMLLELTRIGRGYDRPFKTHLQEAG